MIGRVFLILGLLLTGCASQQVVREGVPADFAISATVYPSPEVERRASRFIVEVDGVLRAAVGDGVSESTFPDQVRQLSHAQYEDLWARISGSGLLERADWAISGGQERLAPTRGTSVLIYVAAWGDRRYFAIPLGEDADVDALVDRLSELAWLRG